MRKYLLLGTLGVGLALAACVGGKITSAETILTACQTFNSSLATVATANNQKPLKASVVSKVDKAVALTDGLCGGASPDINATALDIASVQGANIVLQAVIGEF